MGSRVGGDWYLESLTFSAGLLRLGMSEHRWVVGHATRVQRSSACFWDGSIRQEIPSSPSADGLTCHPAARARFASQYLGRRG